MYSILEDEINIDEMVHLGEEFYIQLYGKVATKAKTLDQVREIMYNLPKYIPITRMPPTSRAFHFHMLRVYFPSQYMETLKGGTGCESCGFFKDVNGNILPTITDKEHAPKYLLREMKCSCQKPNKAGLLCTSCSCVKHGVPCTALCKCIGECCHNENL